MTDIRHVKLGTDELRLLLEAAQSVLDSYEVTRPGYGGLFSAVNSLKAASEEPEKPEPRRVTPCSPYERMRGSSYHDKTRK